MTLLAVERVKLFTTRSPWWCTLVTLTVTVGFAAMVLVNTDSEFPATVATTQFGYQFGLAVIMVLGALAVTTEYRFSTIRTTFQAVPHRGSLLLAKTTVVALLALVIGEIAAFGSWVFGLLVRPQFDLALNSTADWINVAGVGAIYAIASVIAFAVGLLVRHSAGAVALLMIYTLAVENLVSMIPSVGPAMYEWMPFNVANKFLTGASDAGAAGGPVASTSSLSPGWALAYFAAFAAVLLAIAISTANRRDA